MASSRWTSGDCDVGGDECAPTECRQAMSVSASPAKSVSVHERMFVASVMSKDGISTKAGEAEVVRAGAASASAGAKKLSECGSAG